MDSVAVAFRLSVSHADVKRIEYFGICIQGRRAIEPMMLSYSIAAAK